MRRIPEPTILRLSAYRSCLEDYKAHSNQPFISSRELGKLSNRNAAIVRKDLSYFGEYGVPGRGYNVDHLQNNIVRILNLKERQTAILIGVGNLGRALLGYPGFKKHGFEIAAALDNDPKKVGRMVAGTKIQRINDLAKIVSKAGIKIGILTVSAAAAQDVANLLYSAGIRAIINFTPARVWAPKGVILRNVDLTRELEIASYYLARSI